MNPILLQLWRDKVSSVTTPVEKYGTLNTSLYLQEIRDAILGVTTPSEKYGTLNEVIYLQQIRNAILGVADGEFGSLPAAVYLQEIRDAYQSVTGTQRGSLDEDIYLEEVVDVENHGVVVVYETPSYANAGGTGDRTTTITVTTTTTPLFGAVTLILDGNTVDGYFPNAEAVAGLEIKFDFHRLVIIDELKVYGTAYGGGHGTWQWQRSLNGTDWTSIGDPFVLLFGGQTQTYPLANTTPARYYRLLGVSGNMAVDTINEFEFQIGNPL